MPNWCDNRITIHGPKKYIRKIDKIVNENTNGKGLLDYMMPMPKELEDTTSPSSSAKKPAFMRLILVLTFLVLGFIIKL